MAITSAQNVFRYKTVKGILHKVPATLKLFMFLPLCIFCMSFTVLQFVTGIIAAAVIAFICGFTLREQLTDLKPALIYGILLYLLSVFSNLPENIQITDISGFAQIFFQNNEYFRFSLRLIIIVQLSAMLFRTTSAFEIRESLGEIEYWIKRSLSHLPLLGKNITPNRKISGVFSLFLSFIPEIFETWTNINLAWKARGGKHNFRKIITLVFILIALSMDNASKKTKALEARSTVI